MRATFLFLVSSLLLGCRMGQVPPPLPLADVVAADPILGPAGARAPLPYRVGVLPISIGFDPAKRYRGPDETARHASLPDLEDLRDSVVSALRSSGSFSRVERRGTPRTEDLESEAWEAGDDLVLRLELSDYYQEYQGHSNYVWWFLNYAMTVWSAWFVPVDLFGIGIEAQARLGSVQAGATPLMTRTLRVSPVETQQDLTPLDRELVGLLDLSALVNVQNSLGEDNWLAVDRAVSPHARQRLHVELLRALEQDVHRPLHGPERAVVLRNLRKRFAVVVGVDAHLDPDIPAAPHGIADAEAMAAAFASPAGGSLLEGRDLVLLTGELATRARLLAALEAAGRRAAPGDEVLVYFAGLGVSLPGLGRAGEAGPALVLQDSQSDALQTTTLPLRDLLAVLAGLPCERVVLLLDASFSKATPRGRSLDPPDGAPWRGPLLLPAREAGPLSVVLASRPGQPARSLPEAKAGLFSHLVRAGLGGDADSDRDGRIGVGELFQYVQEAVSRRAGLEGYAQEPSAAGLGEVGMSWPR